MVEVNAQDDDQADDDWLVVRVDVVDGETTVEDSDQKGADEGAEDAAFASEEAGAADDDRSDDGEFVALGGNDLGGAKARSEHEAAKPGAEATDDVDAQDEAGCVQAGEAGRLRVAADGIDPAAVGRVAKDEVADDDEGGEENDWDRHPSDESANPSSGNHRRIC